MINELLRIALFFISDDVGNPNVRLVWIEGSTKHSR